MTRTSLRRRKVVSKTPARSPTPEFPITIAVAGELGATDLTRRLARAGLMLKSTEGGSTELVLGERTSDHSTDALRAQLFEAHAIIETARLVVASKLEAVDIETTLDSPLQVAARIVDDVASQLERSTVVVAELAGS